MRINLKNSILSVLLCTSIGHSKTITVGVLDTGFDIYSAWPNSAHNKLTLPKLCKSGHRSFTPNIAITKVKTLVESIDSSTLPKEEDLTDNHGHGTHIAGLIAKNNDDVDYCLVILKVFDPSVDLNKVDVVIEALKFARNIKIDVINYSGGGNDYMASECLIIKELLDNGTKIFAAAGNNSADLNKKPYWPAMCDDRIVKVINVDKNNILIQSSNYDLSGKIPNIVRENGDHVLSFLPDNLYGIMTGTSQATAITTQKYLHQFSKKKVKSDIRTTKKTN